MKPFQVFLPFFIILACVGSMSVTRSPITGLADFLTQSVWTNVESWKKDSSDVFVLDMPDCQLDNNWHFKPDSTLEITEDSIICEPDVHLLDSISCSWLLKENETVLGLYFPASEEEMNFQVFAIGEYELILHLIDQNNPSAPAREKIILKR